MVSEEKRIVPARTPRQTRARPRARKTALHKKMLWRSDSYNADAVEELLRKGELKQALNRGWFGDEWSYRPCASGDGAKVTVSSPRPPLRTRSASICAMKTASRQLDRSSPAARSLPTVSCGVVT